MYYFNKIFLLSLNSVNGSVVMSLNTEKGKTMSTGSPSKYLSKINPDSNNYFSTEYT